MCVSVCVCWGGGGGGFNSYHIFLRFLPLYVIICSEWILDVAIQTKQIKVCFDVDMQLITSFIIDQDFGGLSPLNYCQNMTLIIMKINQTVPP